jgi:uncharacterized SAM-binding protein YcdF (DUF218 family)
MTLATRQVGHWLIVTDPLEPARAIVILAGDFPFRGLEAARIYREGWAPEVWLMRGGDPEHEAVLGGLGWRTSGEEESNRRLLQQLGVPASAIRVLDGRARNTRQEMELIGRELRGGGSSPVILVTSRPHSRRVRATWRAVSNPAGRVVVRPAAADRFDAAAWWRNSRDALAVSREVLGLLNVWAGFPVSPDEGGMHVRPGEHGLLLAPSSGPA